MLQPEKPEDVVFININICEWNCYADKLVLTAMYLI